MSFTELPTEIMEGPRKKKASAKLLAFAANGEFWNEDQNDQIILSLYKLRKKYNSIF